MLIYEEGMDFNKGKVILLFSTEWCGDCIALKNYIDEVVKENSDWKFILVDTDEFSDMATKYSIFGIPSFVGLIDGEVVGELISKESKPKSLINSWIKTLGIINYDK